MVDINKKTVSGTIPKELYERWIKHCREKRYNKSQVLEDLIREFLDKDEKSR